MDLRGAAVLGVVLLMPAVSGRAADDESVPLAEFGFEPTAAGVRQCLARLTPGEEEVQRIAALIEQLDDDDYFTRERATRQLARLPSIPAGTLAEAMKHPSLEVRCRARRLAVIHSSERPQGILKAALGAVVEQKLEGLAPAILTAMRNDPDAPVWKLAQQAVSVTVCNGGPQGYLRTKEAFADYVLSLQWRMPTNTSDSGVGLMMTGPDQATPSCLEVQIHAANSGDFYIIGGFHAEAAGQKIPFRSNKLQPSNEKPPGEWNTMEMLVSGGNVEVKINGLVQNKATGCARQPGKINLRNEGSPVEFRNILLLPLEG